MKKNTKNISISSLLSSRHRKKSWKYGIQSIYQEYESAMPTSSWKLKITNSKETYCTHI